MELRVYNCEKWIKQEVKQALINTSESCYLICHNNPISICNRYVFNTAIRLVTRYFNGLSKEFLNLYPRVYKIKNIFSAQSLQQRGVHSLKAKIFNKIKLIIQSVCPNFQGQLGDRVLPVMHEYIQITVCDP